MDTELIPMPLPADHPLLRDRQPATKPLKLFVREVVDSVSENRGVTREELLGRRRSVDIALARQIAMWIVRRNRPEGYCRIAMCFDRDHGTVMHAVKQVDNLRDVDDRERERIDSILRKLELN